MIEKAVLRDSICTESLINSALPSDGHKNANDLPPIEEIEEKEDWDFSDLNILS